MNYDYLFNNRIRCIKCSSPLKCLNIKYKLGCVGSFPFENELQIQRKTDLQKHNIILSDFEICIANENLDSLQYI